ncbi:hypothetical protein RND71_025070 [Anisodus tanguticus]|uniref:Uncharacterized protein n=1 Tax=Anisodus tanguticus TaxID=243964 RepID=A0AAE1RPA4_9SOLA|nr:hypothetical protein RND71_025070 [Anisodus tanguticus]
MTKAFRLVKGGWHVGGHVSTIKSVHRQDWLGGGHGSSYLMLTLRDFLNIQLHSLTIYTSLYCKKDSLVYGRFSMPIPPIHQIFNLESIKGNLKGFEGVSSDAESRKSCDRAIESGARTWNKTSQKLIVPANLPTPTKLIIIVDMTIIINLDNMEAILLQQRLQRTILAMSNLLKSDIDAANLLSEAS